LGHVSDPGQRERKDGDQASEATKKGGHKRLEKAPTDLGPTGFLLPKAKGCNLCGWLLLARLPSVFSAAETKPGVLENEDRGEPEKGSIGQRTAKKAGVEGCEDQGMSAKKLGCGSGQNPERFF
jgi:hypothetical protein